MFVVMFVEEMAMFEDEDEADGDEVKGEGEPTPYDGGEGYW